MKTWRLSCFGGIHAEVREGAEWRPGPVQPRPLALLACLAMADPLHTRDAILALLWPDRPERLARLALRQSLHHLNARLGPGLILRRGRQRLGLDRERLACDVYRFESALREGRLRDAVTEYRGDFLEGFVLSYQPDAFEEWITTTRLRLLDGAISAVTALSHQELSEPGGTPSGLGWVHRALALSPYSETLLGRAVELHLRRGDRGGAVREVQAFSRRLLEEVGLGASERVLELHDRAAAATGSNEGGEPLALRLPKDGLRAELEAVLSGRAEWMERR
ncbi:MAG: BTAD domain-containing putative transcriptional regulator, partial [Gemmatimonadota bacterium]